MTEATASSHLSIGEVLSLVQEDFPDVTISKIRFLESQGLIAPERTGSGYRKFYEADIDRLRWILRQQRDHFLPLKVIKKMLDEGVDLHGGTESQPTLWSSAESLPGGSSAELADDDDLDETDDPASAAPSGGGDDRQSAGYRSPSHPAVASATARRRPSEPATPEAVEPATAEPASAAAVGGSDRAGGSSTGSSEHSARATSSVSKPATSNPAVSTPPDAASSASSGAGGERPSHAAERDESRDAPDAARAARSERDGRAERDEPAATSSDTSRSSTERSEQPAAAESSESPVPDAPEHARPAHSTPADVVAALQEDPRSARRGRGRPARGDTDATPEPPMPAPASAPSGGFVPTPPLASLLSADELCELTGISPELLAGLEQFGLIVPASLGGRSAYDADAVDVARIAASYVELGVEPRHLRMYKVAAEREAGFIEQLVVPLIKQRNPAARQQANDRCEDLVTMGAQLHAALLRRQLSRLLGP